MLYAQCPAIKIQSKHGHNYRYCRCRNTGTLKPAPLLMLSPLVVLLVLLQSHLITPTSLPTTFHAPLPSNLHLRLINNTFVLASSATATSTNTNYINGGSDSFLPSAGDVLVRVDGNPLSTRSLASILEQIGTTAILPIIDTTQTSLLASSADSVDPGWRVRGFVKIETFAPKMMELKPGWPSRIQEFHNVMQQQQNQVEALKEQARLEAETIALKAAEAQQNLDQQKHELALQESKRKLLEEGQKHELAKTAAEKAAVRAEIEVKRKEQQSEMDTKSKKEAAEKDQIVKLKTLEKQQVEKDRIERANMKKDAEEQFKRDKADKMKQIEEPGFKYFDVEFRGDGSLDLWFKPGIYLPALEQKRAGTDLVPGDVLVGINKEPLPVPGDMSNVMEMLMEASRPRTLRWKRVVVEEKESIPSLFAPLKLAIISPDILAGEYLLTSALFGGNDTCTGIRNVTMGEPTSNGCKPLKRTSVSEPSGAIVGVLRGTCNFVVKMRNVQKAGAKAMVVINNQVKTLAMPSGNFKVEDLKIHAAMAVQDLGDVLSAIQLLAKRLRLGQSVVRGTFVGGNSSCEMTAQVKVDDSTAAAAATRGDAQDKSKGVIYQQQSLPDYIQWHATSDDMPPGIGVILGGSGSMKKAVDDGRGMLYVWNGVNTMAFEVMRGSFGSENLPKDPFVLKLASPIHGCQGTAGNTKRMVIVVERGECPFIKKAKVAQAQNARAVLIINNDENLFRMPAPEKDGKGINIPVAMLPLAAKDYLHKSTLKKSMLLIARLVFKTEE